MLFMLSGAKVKRSHLLSVSVNVPFCCKIYSFGILFSHLAFGISFSLDSTIDMSYF